MTRDRWERLKPLFHGALDQPAAARAAWLEQACPDDPSLRNEALSLLTAHDTASGFLESPPAIALDEIEDELPLSPGQHIGPYRVREEIGRGGMGVVYLAEDTRLGRTVALKALPTTFASDPQRRERLRREARAAAALSHPGIAIVYALEEIDGDLFIASEYVKGRTLRAELLDGAVPADRALAIATDLARALCVAHEAGIVHRDLKPDNVVIADDGRVKILDFGVAHIAGADVTLTQAGAVLGTPAYMAPEQLAGAEADFRADQYALGLMFVEMLTGRHPFAAGGDEARPPAGTRPKPRPYGDVIERMLSRDPRERFLTTRELVNALEQHRVTDSVGTGLQARPGPARTFSPRWWWEFHQAMTAVAYGVMVVPAWTARGAIGGRAGRAMFVALLAAVIVSAILRLHRWFTSRVYPDELKWLRPRTDRWIAAADWIFAATLVVMGLLVMDDRSALGWVLVGFGIGSAIAFLVIEPSTERAAFHSG